MRIPCKPWTLIVSALVISACWLISPAQAQRMQFPETPSGLRPIQPGQIPSSGAPTMVPINPATQAGIYPSNGLGGQTFDPYSLNTATQTQAFQPQFAPVSPPQGSFAPNTLAPGTTPYPGVYSNTQPIYPNNPPMGGYPAYNGISPNLPGAGQSGTIGTFQNNPPGYGQPGVYPNSAPSALFPNSGAYPSGGYNNGGGTVFGNMYNGIFGSSAGGYGGTYGQPAYPVLPQNSGNGYFNPNAWNPQGAAFNGAGGMPQYLRLFQGPRFREAYLYGNNDFDALSINDSDFSVGIAIPNFLYSTQPLYLLPSFSLHQWSGPRAPSTADLPALAYSAFLDSGWQSDPARILGAELGLRVGMFSDFNTGISDSLRIQGRAIGRVRVTPKVTLKGGVVYLDRVRVKLLPAGGVLWQPNPDTRFDLFFPEPKLAHYLATVGTSDTWWYVGGYYGGGSWTVKRDSGIKESIDINDIRLVLGLEWGRNDQMRDGRRVGFLEAGYVFNRELIFKETPLDNLDLQDTFMIRAGIGY